MIKAALKLAEEDMGLAKVISYVVYEYHSHDRILWAYMVREVQIPLGPEAGELEGQVMVARQKTSREEAKKVEQVDGCTFLNMMGEYNKVGHLLDIREEGVAG